jgi:hypothetical protein
MAYTAAAEASAGGAVGGGYQAAPHQSSTTEYPAEFGFDSSTPPTPGQRIANAIGGFVNHQINGAKNFGEWIINAVRAPQDVNVNPTPPAALPTDRPVGKSPTQNAEAQAEVGRMKDGGYTDVRVNQQQVNAQGVRVGIGRPDVQGTSPVGQREYIEFDTSKSNRGPAHQDRLLTNDPAGKVDLRKVD